MFFLSRGSMKTASYRLMAPRIFLSRASSVKMSKQKRNVHLELKQKIEEVHVDEKTDSLYGPWEISQLKSESEVIQAQALLYKVYIKEMGWMFAKDNPTGFRIETSKCGKKLLQDDLESHSSFFGVKFQDELIAVMRRVHRDNNGHLDLTRYESSRNPAIQKLICPSNSPNLVEVQRCAVLKPYRGTNVVPCLFHYLFLDTFQRKFSMIGTTPIGKMKSFLASTLKIQIIDKHFLYSENIEGSSTCFFLSGNAIFRTAEVLEEIIKQHQPSKMLHKA